MIHKVTLKDKLHLDRYINLVIKFKDCSKYVHDTKFERVNMVRFFESSSLSKTSFSILMAGI